MTLLTAESAGKALRTIATKLLEAGIITNEGFQALNDEGFKLGKLKKSTSWFMEVGRGRPVSFERITDKNGDPLNIVLSAAGIEVDQCDEKLPPFNRLDISVAVTDLAGDPVCRWHVDKANDGQAGPLFHLQYGGHLPGFRDRELPISEPRWCHPPMELGLLCEVIAANFFHAQWLRSLRDDAGWCQAVRDLQRLCFSAYASRWTESLAVSDSTALTRMWNHQWR